MMAFDIEILNNVCIMQLLLLSCEVGRDGESSSSDSEAAVDGTYLLGATSLLSMPPRQLIIHDTNSHLLTFIDSSF